MRRVGAAVVAVLMVVVALIVRGRIDDDGDADGGGAGDDATLEIRCATELTSVCNEVGTERDDVVFSIEPAGATADALVTIPDARRRDVGFDAWLVPEPWPAIVDVRRAVNGLKPVFVEPTEAVARSPLVLVVRTDRVPVLEGSGECAGTVSWKCVGELAGRPWESIGGPARWGRIKPGHGAPANSATGLFALSQATAGYLGTVEYDRFQLQDDDAYGDWLSALERSIPNFSPPNGTPFLEMLNLLPTAAYDVVGTTEAEAGPGRAAAAPDRRRQLTLLYPDPMVTADIVLAPVVGSDTEAVDDLAGSDDLRAALAADGWRVPGEPRAPGVPARPALADTSGLPDDPGALVALQDTWRGVVG